MINLISSIIVLVFLLFGFLWGFIRGLKKSTFRGVWLIGTMIICLIFSPLISKLVCNINISGLNINIDGTTANSVKDAINLSINLALKGTNLESLPMLTSLAEKLPIIILNPFVFVILFWILKIILLPINAIIAKIIFKNKKTTKSSGSKLAGNELAEKKNSKVPVKKHRLYGGLVGIVVGLIVCCATFVPVFGVLNIATELNNTTITVIYDENDPDSSSGIIRTSAENTSTTKEISLLEYLLGDNVKYYNEIEQSAGLKVLKYTGVQAISNMQFTSLTSTNINGANISLSNDVKSALSLSNDIMTISKFDANNPTKDTLGAVINSTLSILEKSKQITLLQIVSQEDIAYICNEVLNNPDSIINIPDTNNQFTNDLIRTAVTSLSNYDINHIIDDVIQLVNIVKSSNDYDVLLPLIKNEINDEKQAIDFISNISTEFYDNVVDCLFNIDIINSVIPMSADYGIKELCNYLGFESTETTTTNVDIIKQFAKNVLKDSISIVKEIDFDSKYYVTDTAIKQLGKLLDDTTKEYNANNQTDYIISPSLLSNLLTKAEDLILDKLNGNVSDDLLDTLTPIVRNISRISSYEEEFDKLGQSFNYLKPYIDFALDNPTLDTASQLNLTNLGKAIDIINTTTLFSNKFSSIYNYAIDSYLSKQTINDVSLETLANHLKITENSNIVYEIEFDKLNDLYVQLLNFAKDPDMDKFLKGEEIKVLGKNLQTIKQKSLNQTTSSLFDVDTLVVDLLEVMSSMDLSADITQIIVDTRTEIINTENKETIDYEVEFTHIYNAMQTLQNSETNTINDYLDIADLIVNGNEELKPSTILVRPIYNFVCNNTPSSEEYTELFIKAIINTLKSNIENKSQQVDPRNEITNFIKLFKQLDNLENLDENDSDFEDKLNELSNVVEYINTNSILLTNLKTETISQLFKIVQDNVTNDNLKTALDSAKDDAINSNESLSQIYNDIKQIKDEFSDLDYSEDDLNDATLVVINNKLKNTDNLASFSCKTTNAIYTVILNSIKDDVINQINNNDISSLPLDKQEEIENYKEEFTQLITSEINALESINDTDVQNDYYLTSLAKIKLKAENKPTI